METLFSILCLAAMAYGAFRGLKWMLRSGQTRSRGSEPLSPADLKLLEESASRLTSDLKVAADECIARIEAACATADRKIACLAALASSGNPPASDLDATLTTGVRRRSIFEMIDACEPVSLIAKESGALTGEVELMRDLRAIDPGRPPA